MTYYYLDSNNQPAGPASLDEIRALARSGAIAADPLVRPDGGADWKLLSAISAGAPAARAGQGGLLKSTLLGDLVGGVLSLVSRLLNPSFVERSLAFAKWCGHFAVLAGAALTLLYTIFAAIKFNSFALFMTGLGFIIALAVAQFAASRFLDAAGTLIRNTPSRIASPAFLECVGLLLLLLAISLLITGLTTSIRAEIAAPFITALLVSAGLVYFSTVALHPSLVNIEEGAGSAGEEAIGLLSFFFKAWLKLVPLFFFLFGVLGCLTILFSFFNAGQSFAMVVQSLLALMPIPLEAPQGLIGSATILLACLIPILAYFFFLLQYLFLDVIRAILAVPGKLDALRR